MQRLLGAVSLCCEDGFPVLGFLGHSVPAGPVCVGVMFN